MASGVDLRHPADRRVRPDVFLPSQVASLMGTHLGFKASLVAAIPWAFSALGVYFLPRFADRNTARRLPIAVACMVAAALGLAVSSYAGRFARYRRTELLCSQFPGGTADFLDVSRSGAHRPGTGGRHRLLHHARRGVQLLARLSAPRRNSVFTARTPGRWCWPPLHCCAPRCCGRSKPAHRREQARRKDCRIAARYLAIIEPADGTLAFCPSPTGVKWMN